MSKRVTRVLDYEGDWSAYYEEDELMDQGHISFIEDEILRHFGLESIDVTDELRATYGSDEYDTFPNSLQELKDDLNL